MRTRSVLDLERWTLSGPLVSLQVPQWSKALGNLEFLGISRKPRNLGMSACQDLPILSLLSKICLQLYGGLEGPFLPADLWAGYVPSIEERGERGL